MIQTVSSGSSLRIGHRTIGNRRPRQGDRPAVAVDNRSQTHPVVGHSSAFASDVLLQLQSSSSLCLPRAGADTTLAVAGSTTNVCVVRSFTTLTSNSVEPYRLPNAAFTARPPVFLSAASIAPTSVIEDTSSRASAA